MRGARCRGACCRSGGRLLFAAIALLVSVPFLLRIHRRFQNWLAPTLSLAAMAVTSTLSTLAIAPLITGSDRGSSQLRRGGPRQPPG